MQQTLFALAALAAFSLFALSQHRSGAALERAAVVHEIEQAALGVAREALGGASRLAFDQEDLTRTTLRTTPPASPLGPDPGETTPAQFNDVDDYHGYSEVRVVPWGTGTLAFSLRYTVRYVDPQNPGVAAARSLAKEVALQVREVPPPGTSRPPVTVTLTYVATPATQALFNAP
ncbi:MAG: hypothetical protein ACK41D_00615 [Rubricoccaceae bacterium]